MTILNKLVEQRKKRPKQIAVQYFKNSQLYKLNWSQVYDRTEQYFQILKTLGIEEGDRIAIYSNTCKEWGFLDTAIMACGAVTVPLYHSAHPEEVSVILKESAPKIIFVQNESLYRVLKKQKLEQTQIICIDDFEIASDNSPLFLRKLLDSADTKFDFEDAVKKTTTSQLATIIYTSGTSGTPKGVCLTHEQIMSAVAEVYPLLGVTHLDRTLTFLPFSHVLGRVELWGHFFSGYCLSYAESIDKIKKNIPVIQPTVIVGVPRIFEKIYFGIKAQVEISKLKQGLFNRALNIGMKNTRLRQNKKSPSLLQALKSQVAHQLVFSQIHQKLGGNLRFAVSGGAPLDPQIADFFAACGLPILEGYGLTETTGPIFVNTLFEHKTGAVGKAIGEVQIKFDEDQEILIKSKKVMTGYYQNQEASQKVMTEDGYFRTGDIGEIDAEGYLKITDRKKDLIKTAGGKFVAPQKIQNLFSVDPLVSHVHVHGDKKKYIVALFTLDKDQLFKLKKQHGLNSSDFSQLTQSDIVQSEVRQSVAKINSGLASFETIKRFKILDQEFSIEGGELTPSLKMKRKKIDEKYQSEIDSLY